MKREEVKEIIYAWLAIIGLVIFGIIIGWSWFGGYHNDIVYHCDKDTRNSKLELYPNGRLKSVECRN